MGIKATEEKKKTDASIRTWIREGMHFEGKSFGGGLYLRFRKQDTAPVWRFRYSFAGKPRVMNLGSYTNLSLADATKTAKQLSARVALGFDVAGEKQERKRATVAKIEADKNAVTVAKLADEYFERMILGQWKHPNIVRSRIDNDIKPRIGTMRVEDVRPRDIDALLQAIVKRGAPTMANDVLRWCKRIFNFGLKREYLIGNPAAAFEIVDAGGQERSRNRWLDQDELKLLFSAMREVAGKLVIQNHYVVRLLLMLGVRKEELTSAPWSEFDLDGAVWHLPDVRTKTSTAIDIPLPSLAVETLRELKTLGCGSPYVFPARKMQTRMVPYISPDTINAAMAKHVRPLMKGIESFTIHDFRRTTRTHLAALGTSSVVAERCLNHKLRGVEGIYDQHDYFSERRDALNKWAFLLTKLEHGESDAGVDYSFAETLSDDE